MRVMRRIPLNFLCSAPHKNLSHVRFGSSSLEISTRSTAHALLIATKRFRALEIGHTRLSRQFLDRIFLLENIVFPVDFWRFRGSITPEFPKVRRQARRRTIGPARRLPHRVPSLLSVASVLNARRDTLGGHHSVLFSILAPASRTPSTSF